MRRPLSMAVRFFTIAAVVTAMALAFAPPSRTASPYLSALSDLAASPVLAAKKNCNSMCEFVAPAFTCLSESPGTRCVRTTTGCTSQNC